MEKLSLSQRLLKYLGARPREWVSSGTLQRLTMAHTDQTARTAVRRLQELAEEGKLDRELRKGHTWYRIKQESENRATESRHTILQRNQEALNWFDNYVPSQ